MDWHESANHLGDLVAGGIERCSPNYDCNFKEGMEFVLFNQLFQLILK